MKLRDFPTVIPFSLRSQKLCIYVTALICFWWNVYVGSMLWRECITIFTLHLLDNLIVWWTGISRLCVKHFSPTLNLFLAIVCKKCKESITQKRFGLIIGNGCLFGHRLMKCHRISVVKCRNVIQNKMWSNYFRSTRSCIWPILLMQYFNVNIF